MKIFILGVYIGNLPWSTLEADLEMCFVEHILDALMKRAPVGLFYILGIQYMIDDQ